MSDSPRSICLLPRLEGLGGPASFYARFGEEARRRGRRVHNDPFDPSLGSVLVIGGTRHIDKLWRAKRRGVHIVQRLDGMNWIHRKRRTGIRHYLRSEVNNMILAFIRRHLADDIVYQSDYVEGRWLEVYGAVKAKNHLIYNGVDLNVFTPSGSHQRPEDHIRLLVVEGRLRGGHEVGLANAIRLGETLDKQTDGKIELMVVADVDPGLAAAWETRTDLWITWGGVQPRSDIPHIDRSAHLFFSAEVNAPCPNSVIEALASGLPVVSFSTGSLPELVHGDAGRLVPYGDNYARLGAADHSALASAAVGVLADLERFRQGARKRAEAHFNIETVVDRYLEILR